MKLHLIVTLFFFTLILSACAPTSYVYLKPDAIETKKIEEVLIMVEFLSAKEGFDAYWDFDENKNIASQDALYLIAEKMLSEKGYVVSDKNLKTSGLIMNRSFELDHYLNDKKQQQLISPPYIIRSVNMEDVTIQGLEGLLAELNTPISAVMQDYRIHLNNNYKSQTRALEISENSAILIIEVYQPRKSLLTNIELEFSSNNLDPHIGFGSFQPPAISKAYFIHTGSGDVMWSNKRALITSKNQHKFFAELPKVLLQ